LTLVNVKGYVGGVCTVQPRCRSASLPRSLGARSFARLGRRAGRLASASGLLKQRQVGVLGLQPFGLPLPALANPPIFVSKKAEACLCPLASAQKGNTIFS